MWRKVWTWVWGLGMNLLSLWPGMPPRMALALGLVGGGLLVVATVALLWGWLGARLPIPFWLPAWAWRSLTWAQYGPSVSASNIQTHYQIVEGNVAMCRIYVRVAVQNEYPHGDLQIDASGGRLVVSQKRGGSTTAYVFHLGKGAAEVKIQPGRWFETSLDFVWEQEGAPESRGPNLDASFAWRVHSLRARLSGVYEMRRDLPRLKGTKIGRG